MANENISRRNFVAGAAAAGIAAGVAGMAGADEAPARVGVPTEWDYEADIVVIGYGGAGAVAAFTAADEGAEVIILEKAPFEGGGSTRMCAGSLYWLNDVETGAKHMEFLSGGATPYDVCEAFAKVSNQFPEWAEEIGLDLGEMPTKSSAENVGAPYAEAVVGVSMPGAGPRLWEVLNENVEDRGIEVLFDTPATELIQDPITKEILGVRAEQSGNPIVVKARKAVAMTCGGFMYNEEQKLNFLRMYPFVSYSWRYNTGDCIKMCQKVGADLWHMGFIMGRASMWFPELEPGVAGFIGGTPKANNYILTDRYGRRFENEKAGGNHSKLLKLGEYHTEKLEYERIPVYLIFDETARLAGPLGRTDCGSCVIPEELGGGTQPWSADNSYEIEQGWIKQADTLEELVEKLNEPCAAYEKTGIQPALEVENVIKSIETYNAACEAGVDEQFGTNPEKLAPVITPPFYGMPLWPGCSDNPGGPKRNAMMQIVDPDNNPIPRLYGAGSGGCILGLLYPRGGGFVMDALICGQIIGKNMAAEEPWE